MEFKYNDNSLKSGIYKITNIYNNRFYYGSCKLFKVRWSQHKASLLRDKHQNKFLQADFNKCFMELKNDDFLLFEVIEVVEGDKDLRLKIEEEKYLKPCFDSGKECYNLINRAVSREGYPDKNPEETKKKKSVAIKKRMQNPEERQQILNNLLIGQKIGGMKGKTHSIETKEKMSVAKIGKLKSIETKERMSKAQKGKISSFLGKHHTEEAKRKIANGNKGNTKWLGKTHTEETKKKISNANKGKIVSLEQRIERSLRLKGKKLSDKHKKAISRGNIGRIVSEETKAKIRKAHQGMKLALDAKKKLRKIYFNLNLVSPNGEIITAINDIYEFCEKYNLSRPNILNVINGKRKSHKEWKNL